MVGREQSKGSRRKGTERIDVCGWAAEQALVEKTDSSPAASFNRETSPRRTPITASEFVGFATGSYQPWVLGSGSRIATAGLSLVKPCFPSQMYPAWSVQLVISVLAEHWATAGCIQGMSSRLELAVARMLAPGCSR